MRTKREERLEGVSFIIPCFNERPDVLAGTVGEIDAAVRRMEGLDFEILVVDDGSEREGYAEAVAGKARLIRHPRNMGYGASLLTGIEEARHEVIGISDADGTYPVARYPELIARAGEHDMVVGARRWGEIPLSRRPVKFLLTLLASHLAGCRIPDLNSGMRLFRKELVRKHIRVFPMGFSFTSTLTMICLTNRYTVDFVEIPYSRRVGRSSIDPLADTVRFFSLTIRLALYFRPLRFFMPLSGILLLLAMARGIRDVITVNAFGGLTLVLFFMAFQVFFFGLIAEIINKK